jgi:hypothetical protein
MTDSSDLESSVTRMELFIEMKNSEIPIADQKRQLILLRKYICEKLTKQLDEKELLELESRLHFFQLEIRKRFLSKGIRQNSEKFLKKYSETFLSKKFELPEMAVTDFNEIQFPDEPQFNLKSKMGLGRLSKSKELKPSENGNKLQTGKVTRRVGLNKNEIVNKSLHF